MDQEIRNKLRNVVTQCRKLLEDSISQELEGKYGIFAKKDQVTADPNAKMTHLTEEEQAARKDILDHFAHIQARDFKPKEAFDQLVREIAFTHLNRLCAYKMMEAREVYVGGQKFREAVSRGVNSNGVKFYLAEHEDDERLFNTGHQDVAYRHFLDWLGGLLSDEIGVLFNPNDPANRLYPRQKTLEVVLELLNEGGIKADEAELRDAWPKIWSQDETIGWVYQYFTPKELRDQARKESQAPRNSYELAFRNQFFTPRYVVEFLTDNTLGRIWYEMRKGDTKLKDQCRYMVRRPTEIFLASGGCEPPVSESSDDLSQEDLLRQPVHISYRPKKDPRELKIFDPACGSGHFLLYCFDLLLTIYEEAYADPDLGPELRKDYPKLEDLRRDVPRLILAHNLHGIDIDLRASQIAALALWLRCQRAYQEMGLKKDRPKITRSNFVCAEPMPGEEQMLTEFVGQLEPKLLGQLVAVVFDKMELAGEAGSLLKIEEEIRDAVAAAKRQWEAGPIKIQLALFDKVASKPQQKRFDLFGITNEEFFSEAETMVVEALRQYSEKAQNGERLQRRLFTEDAVRGFAFVDLCHKRFDVVLMNPPFGESSKPAKVLIEKQYPRTKNDVYAAFVEQGINRLNRGGTLGAITSRTGFFLTSFQKWREEILLNDAPPTTFADLGYGVLDTAMVETAAYCLTKGSGTEATTFFRLLQVNDKEVALLAATNANSAGESAADVFHVNPASFGQVPGSPFAYWVSERIRRLFTELPPFESAGREARRGASTGDDTRRVRTAWEVPVTEVGRMNRWVPFSKGGSYSPYYADVHLLVGWDESRQTFEGFYGRPGRMIERPEALGYFFRSGLTWPRRTTSGMSVRVLPEGCVFGDKGPTSFIPPEDRFALLSLMNSAPFMAIVGLQLAAADAAARSYEPGLIQRTPIPRLESSDAVRLTELAETCLDSKRGIATATETSHVFHLPASLQVPGRTLDERGASWQARVADAERQLSECQREIDDIAFGLYGIEGEDRRAIENSVDRGQTAESSDEEGETEAEYETPGPDQRSLVAAVLCYSGGCVLGRWDVRYVTSERPSPELPDPFAPLPVCSPGMLKGPDGLPLRETPDDGYPLRIDWDGILVDDPKHPDDIIHRVREVLELVWKDRAEAIEQEACEILGVKDLRDYFRKSGAAGFWDDHVKRYSKSRRKAPIYWLLQSSRKNYALWLYYHRLDKDLLFKSLVNYVEPKIRLETIRLDTLRGQKAAAGESGKEAKRLAKEVERQEDFLSELRDFEDKLRRAANLHLEPDLNDGVVLNIAPLHELVPWKEAKNYWEELLAGEYEWSSIGKQLREKGLVK